MNFLSSERRSLEGEAPKIRLAKNLDCFPLIASCPRMPLITRSVPLLVSTVNSAVFRFFAAATLTWHDDDDDNNRGHRLHVLNVFVTTSFVSRLTYALRWRVEFRILDLAALRWTCLGVVLVPSTGFPFSEEMTPWSRKSCVIQSRA